MILRTSSTKSLQLLQSRHGREYDTAMTVTPNQILTLALRRHRIPWNWTFHFVSLGAFALTLLFHSYLMFAATTILFGAGFFDLQLPPMRDNRWHHFAHAGIEWEKNWIASPWNWSKVWRFLFVLTIACVTIWALWTQDAAVLALLTGYAVLMRSCAKILQAALIPREIVDDFSA
jgi:hypothetical protein